MKISDEKILDILVREGIITEEHKNACLFYQEEYFKRRGEKVPLTTVLEKLEILPSDKIKSIMKALNLADSEEEGKKSEKLITLDIITEEEQIEVPKAKIGKISKRRHRKEIEEKLKEDEEEKKEGKKEIILEEREEKEEVKDEKSKSLFISYILLVFFGYLGAHRIYLRYYRTGILYTLTLGFLGIGVILDIFLLPFLFKKYNENIENYENEFIYFYNLQRDKNKTPSWLKLEKGLEKAIYGLDIFFQMLFLLVSPIFILLISLLLWKPLFIILTFIWGIFFLLNNTLKQKISEFPSWKNIPFLTYLINNIDNLKKFYFNNKPKFSLFYLFYPLWFPIGIFFKKRIRQELYLYLWIIFIGMSYILINIFYTFYSMKVNILEIKELFLFYLFLNIVGFIIFFSFLTPLSVSLTSFEIKNREKISKIASIVILLILLIGMFIFILKPIKLKYFYTQYFYRNNIAKIKTEYYKNQTQKLLKFYSYLILEKQIKEKEKDKWLKIFLKAIYPQEETEFYNVKLNKEDKNIYFITLNNIPIMIIDKVNKKIYTSYEEIKGNYIKGILDNCMQELEKNRKEYVFPINLLKKVEILFNLKTPNFFIKTRR